MDVTSPLWSPSTTQLETMLQREATLPRCTRPVSSPRSFIEMKDRIALFRDLNLHLTRNHLVHVDKQIEQRGYQQVYWKTYNRPLRSRAKALVALRAAKEKHSYKRAERPTSSGCKGNCLSNRCSCRKGGKKCGGVCRCLKCENQ